MAPHDNENGKENGNGHPQSSDSDPSVLAEELKAQSEKWKNDYLYLRAEFDTFRRNAAKERADLMKYGCERVFVDLLNVVDNFDRALHAKATPENLASFVKGVEMTAHELRHVLTKFGITESENKIGAPFDPSVHEALSSEPAAAIPPGHIARVLRKAYKLHDKLIRPAQVIVAKAPEGKGE